MKYKTTRRALKNYYDSALAVGYCDAHYLLSWTQASSYTCGVYGWNFDAYDVNGVLITTGYRNLIGQQSKFVSEYEEKAKKIWSWDNKDSYNKKIEDTKKLCLEWIKKEFSK